MDPWMWSCGGSARSARAGRTLFQLGDQVASMVALAYQLDCMLSFEQDEGGRRCVSSFIRSQAV
jgi:hypothetical protein